TASAPRRRPHRARRRARAPRGRRRARRRLAGRRARRAHSANRNRRPGGHHDPAIPLRRPGYGVLTPTERGGLGGGAGVPQSYNRGFEQFEVEADVGIRAWGPTRAEAFAQAALGVLSLVADPATVNARETREVRAQADAAETLLAAWIDECL